MTLTTNRLRLIALTPPQLAIATTNLTDVLSELGLYITNVPQQDIELSQKIYAIKCNNIAAHPAEWLFCTSWQMALSSGCVIGEIGFKGVPVDGTIELGYGTQEQYRNRGYMREAVTALCRFGFTQAGITSIKACTYRENFASQRVLEVCGFKEIGVEDGLLVWQLAKTKQQDV